MKQDLGITLLQLSVALLVMSLALNLIALASYKNPLEFVETDAEGLRGMYQRMEALENEVRSRR